MTTTCPSGQGGGRRTDAGGLSEIARDLLDEDLPRNLGRYILLRRIARGGMGEVFLASTSGLEGAERPVVVKVIRREHAKDPSFIARFLDEARVQSQLQHSGVAQVLDATVDEGSGDPYAVIEHVEGRSLGDARARAIQLGQRIAWTEAVSLATLIAEALAHVHERQDAAGRELSIVHRDLSPQNVMVSYAGDIKIIDFGTARGQNRRCHTVAGVVFAKPGYVAPEVANGETGDARVDVYALGVMLWELCAGRRFLQGDAQEHMAAVARNASSPPPIAAEAGAPEELDVIIANLTAFDREQRYAAARLAARDMAKLLAVAPPLPSGERGVRARVSDLMHRLFPSEPARTRREFAKLVIAARPLRAKRAASDPKPAGPAASPSAAGPQAQAERAARDALGDGVLPGTRYRLLREAGRGASSVVYEAVHVDLGRHVALKVLVPGAGGGSREPEARLRREARATSRLAHDGLVKLLDFGVAADGRPYCVMEHVEGETLDVHLRREQEMDFREALGIAAKTLEALEVVHAAGVVHRDIKPANLMLSRGGAVKILDFGLARSPEEDDDEGARREEAAAKSAGVAIFGTPEYMAPEQVNGASVDARADLYALGCVLYEMLTGRLPFVAAGSVSVLDAKLRGSPERPRDRAPARDIPHPVDELVVRALSRHPAARFQSAAEMRAAVAAALDAPLRARSMRRMVGFAVFAACMAFGGVLVAGKAQAIRGVIESSLPFFGRAIASAPAAPPHEPSRAPAGAVERGADADGLAAAAQTAEGSAAAGATVAQGMPADAADGVEPGAEAEATRADSGDEGEDDIGDATDEAIAAALATPSKAAGAAGEQAREKAESGVAGGEAPQPAAAANGGARRHRGAARSAKPVASGSDVPALAEAPAAERPTGGAPSDGAVPAAEADRTAQAPGADAPAHEAPPDNAAKDAPAAASVAAQEQPGAGADVAGSVARAGPQAAERAGSASGPSTRHKRVEARVRSRELPGAKDAAASKDAPGAHDKSASPTGKGAKKKKEPPSRRKRKTRVAQKPD